MHTRTIRIPVAEVLDGGTKAEFYADVRESLDLARRAAVLCYQHLFRSDAALTTGDKLMPLKGAESCYQQINHLFPGVTTIGANIARAAEARYRQDRWEISKGRRSVPNVRSFPWPLLSNKGTKTVTIEDRGEFVVATIRLVGQRWVVRLAGGSNYRHSIRGLRRAINEGAIGDSKLWTDRKHKAIFGLSVRLPSAVSADEKRSGTLTVSTQREVLISASKPQTRIPFVITGNECREWIAVNNKRRQRLLQDRKSGTSRRAINKRFASLSRKYKNRMDSFIHAATAKIIKHAIRQRVAEVALDSTIRSYLPTFPYFQLAEKLRYKCEDAGLLFTDLTQAVIEPDAEKPQIYFALGTETGRVKIGKSKNGWSARFAGGKAFASEEMILLAVDNQPKTKLTAREKHWHAVFAEHRIQGKHMGDEWFVGDPVIEWLRAAQWLGNAGNLSQIAQVVAV